MKRLLFVIGVVGLMFVDSSQAVAGGPLVTGWASGLQNRHTRLNYGSAPSWSSYPPAYYGNWSINRASVFNSRWYRANHSSKYSLFPVNRTYYPSNAIHNQPIHNQPIYYSY